MPCPGCHRRRAHFTYLNPAALLLACASAIAGLAQQPPHPHPPPIAMVNVPRVVVPDVRGRRPNEAQELLEHAGLRPGTTSTGPGPGIVGAVLRQEPEQNSVVVRGTVFNLVLVAPSNVQKPEDGDEAFSRQVPKLLGLTPNQASNLLEPSRLELGHVSTGAGKGVPGTVYAQRPAAGNWVKVGSRVDVEVVEQPKSSSETAKQRLFVLVPNLFGQTPKGATEILIEDGLRLGTVSSGRASSPAGTIFGQVPAANQRVVEGTEVQVQVALATPPKNATVTVPDLVHVGLQAGKVRLAQSGLQLGAVTSEESQSPLDSIIAQSPDAGAQVERGASVSVTVAKEIALVEVPNLLEREEAEAQVDLQNTGLQMGAVTEQKALASSGTVLSQNPAAGARVQKGTVVDLVVSRQVLTELTVMIDRSHPRKGELLTFHAHLEPMQHEAKYRFTFGDGQATDWLNNSRASHTYRKAGEFQVQAFAERRGATVSSEIVTVTIPRSNSAILVGLTAGSLALGGGAYFYHGRRLFRKWIRVVPKPDLGMAQMFMPSEYSGYEEISVRVVHDFGEQTIS